MKTNKKTLAKRMMTPKEIKGNKPPFQSAEWERRKALIAKRIKDRAEENRARALLRKEKSKPKSQTKKEIKKAQALLKKVEAKKKKQQKYDKKTTRILTK